MRRVMPFVIVIAALAAVGAGYWIWRVYAPNNTLVSFREYYGAGVSNPYERCAVFNDEVINDRLTPAALVVGDMPYVAADFIEERQTGVPGLRIFWEEGSWAVTITTRDTVVRMYAGETAYTVNGEAAVLKTAVYRDGGGVYFPADFIDYFWLRADSVYDNGIVVIEDICKTWPIKEIGVKKAALRVGVTNKASVLEWLGAGARVVVYDEFELTGYARVRDLGTGVVGFVPAKQLGGEVGRTYTHTSPTMRSFYVPNPTGRITMLWEQFFSAEGAAKRENWDIRGGLTVLSPTWFSFEGDYGGGLVDIGNREYVDWAHDNGALVWALLSDNFDGDVTALVLRDTEKRGLAIERVLELAGKYNLDGINVDFEMVRAEDAAYYIEFLRELAVPLHWRGLVLSVDMYVPAAHNLYYDRAAVSAAADYIVVMAYDEYWAGRGEAGPVASIGFARDGVDNTLNEVGRSQVIMGVPLYNRVWTTWADGEVVSKAYAMGDAEALFEGGDIVWDDETGTAYARAEGEEGGRGFVREAWIEGGRSLALKLGVAKERGLAGVAGWKRQTMADEVWGMFEAWKR